MISPEPAPIRSSTAPPPTPIEVPPIPTLVEAPAAPPAGALRPLRVLRRFWHILVLAVLIGGALGWAAATSADVRYESEVTILVGPLSADPDVFEGTTDLARTYGEIAESQILIEQAAIDAGIDPADVEVAGRASSNTPLLHLTVRSSSKNATPEIAVGLVAALEELVSSDRLSITSSQLGGPVIGSEIVVLDIDDRAASTALSVPIGIVLGAGALGLSVAGVALASEIFYRDRIFQRDSRSRNRSRVETP